MVIASGYFPADFFKLIFLYVNPLEVTGQSLPIIIDFFIISATLYFHRVVLLVPDCSSAAHSLPLFRGDKHVTILTIIP